MALQLLKRFALKDDSLSSSLVQGTNCILICKNMRFANERVSIVGAKFKVSKLRGKRLHNKCIQKGHVPHEAPGRNIDFVVSMPRKFGRKKARKIFLRDHFVTFH